MAKNKNWKHIPKTLIAEVLKQTALLSPIGIVCDTERGDTYIIYNQFMVRVYYTIHLKMVIAQAFGNPLSYQCTEIGRLPDLIEDKLKEEQLKGYEVE